MRYYIASLTDSKSLIEFRRIANALILLEEGAIQTDTEPALHAQETTEIVIDHFTQTKLKEIT